MNKTKVKNETNCDITSERALVRKLFKQKTNSHNIYYYNNKRTDGTRKVVFKSYGDKGMDLVWDSVLLNLNRNKVYGWEKYTSKCEMGDGSSFGITCRIMAD